MANGDSTMLLVEELFSGPWRDVMEAVFYFGAVYGAYKAAQVISAAVKGFRTYFIPLGRAVSNLERYGQWAVITGATSTLGSAFANEIARNGLNVVLVSHNERSMKALREQIQTQHGVQAVGLCCTIGSGEKMLTSLKETLITLNLEIGLLVNISPIQYAHPQFFSYVPHTRLWQLVSRNIAPMTMMTHLVLPAMVERRKGAIINVSSSVGTAPPTPLLGAYTATMSYITHLSLALHKECSHKGVTVQTLVPWRISPDQTTTMFSPSASTYVRHALSTLGVSHYCCGYWLHGIQGVFFSLWPGRLWTWLANYYNYRSRRAELRKSMDQENPQIFQRRKIYGGSSIPSTAGSLKPIPSPVVDSRPLPIPPSGVTSSVPTNIAVDGDTEEQPVAANFLSLQQQPRDQVFSSGRTMEVMMGRGGSSYKRQYSNIISLPSATREDAQDDMSATI